MNRFLCTVAGILLLVAGGAAAHAQGGRTQAVAVAPLLLRELPASIRVVGTVRSNKESIVAAEVSGLIAEFPAQEGDFLKRGAVICRLDDDVARLLLDEARAELAASAAVVTELENGTRPEELRRAAASLDEAQAIFEKWRFEKSRVADLRVGGSSSAKELHDAEMEFIASEGRLAQAQALFDLAKAGPRAEHLAKARYDQAAQAAIVARLERDLAKTQIRAPFDGFIVAKHTEIGEWIEAGGAVCDMIDVETVRVRVDVPESAARYAQAGANATIEIEALGRSQSAAITRLIPRAQAAARTFPVEIDLPNAEHTILPGMFVRAVVPAGPTAQRLMAPRDAILPQGQRKIVFVVRDGGEAGQMAMPLNVETGLEIGGRVEISGPGLQAGDQVVVRANERLYGPTPVMPTPLAAAEMDAAEANRED